MALGGRYCCPGREYTGQGRRVHGLGQADGAGLAVVAVKTGESPPSVTAIDPAARKPPSIAAASVPPASVIEPASCGAAVPLRLSCSSVTAKLPVVVSMPAMLGASLPAVIAIEAAARKAPDPGQAVSAA